MLGDSLTDAEFQKFSELIYAQCGIFLKPEKKELLNARLGKRLRFCQIDTFAEYYRFILRPEEQKREFIHFLDSVSTNFTSFFREISHFEILTRRVLPELSDRTGGGGFRDLFFWSSASSSGEEPYTLAMILEDYFASHPRLPYRILATDISTKVLDKATKGVYGTEQIAKVPGDFLKRFFQKGVGASAGKVKIKDSIRQKVRLERFNLMHDFPWRGEMHVIFCRNVMIYFDRSTQQKLVQKFHQALAPGGYLFIGHSESIANISHPFKQVEATTYQKP